MDDLEAKIFARFDDQTVVHPGHGDDTTLGAERPQPGGMARPRLVSPEPRFLAAPLRRQLHPHVGVQLATKGCANDRQRALRPMSYRVVTSLIAHE